MVWNWGSPVNIPGILGTKYERMHHPRAGERPHVDPSRLNIVSDTRSQDRRTVVFRVYDPISKTYADIEVTDEFIQFNTLMNNAKNVYRLIQEHAASIIETNVSEASWRNHSLIGKAVRKLDEFRRIVPVSVPSKEAHEAAVADARAAGMEIVTGRPDLLLLDFDEGVPPEFTEFLPQINETYGVVEQQSWLSKSGYPHIHVKVVMRTPIPAVERIALQALLGSDPLRELLTLQRIRNGEGEPSCLFRPSRVNEVPTLETINILAQIVAAGKPTP